VIRLEDIGIFKLRSASSRKAKKDIYDSDRITDQTALGALLDLMAAKEKRYPEQQHKCLFDLDDEPSPLNDVSVLLQFDDVNYSALPSRPSHSNDRLDLCPGSKSWIKARSEWKRKVKQFMKEKGISPPDIQPVD
jgi:hypothetical protein